MIKHFPDVAVRYVGSRPMTDIIASRRSFSSEFIVSGVMFRMGLIQETILLGELILYGDGVSGL